MQFPSEAHRCLAVRLFHVQMVALMLNPSVSLLIVVLAAGVSLAADTGTVARVAPVLETPPVGVVGDAADDPAIVTGATPLDARVIGTQKKGGLYVYDLKGRVVQEILSGRPNNVDVRTGFAWPEGEAPIVVTSDRADNTVKIYRFDPATRMLQETVRASIATGFGEVYGVAIGRLGPAFVVVATDKDGDVAQWTLSIEAGEVRGVETRRFALGSIAEGAVIDDARGALYVSEEMKGLWRFALDPSAGNAGTLVDEVGPSGRLVADVEGLSIWAGQGGAGYLVASVQGASRYNVYERAAPNRFRGTFRIADRADRTVDGVSETDGIDVVGQALSPRFPRGLLVVQDDENTLPAETQNFKFVSWAEVERALGLPALPMDR
jgi:3-phytase